MSLTFRGFLIWVCLKMLFTQIQLVYHHFHELMAFNWSPIPRILGQTHIWKIAEHKDKCISISR